ncbi:MAG: S-adenosylmethionine:tRNA ribosyltransferase-isomerase, partial [Bacteroidetes bacterium]|nr:S-adenosylmethionine:tRNA ribosyltransferase-isomerase [Bacteroidota bacterium]
SDSKISVEDSLSHLLKYMSENKLDKIFTQTKIIIAPGYNFKIVKAIVTNFHQPKSTLLLLIAAALGEKWKEIYEYALQNDFRFLSYGDGSLLYVDQG